MSGHKKLLEFCKVVAASVETQARYEHIISAAILYFATGTTTELRDYIDLATPRIKEIWDEVHEPNRV